MLHDIPLITTLSAGFGLALVLGFAAARLRLPPLLGYVLVKLGWRIKTVYKRRRRRSAVEMTR